MAKKLSAQNYSGQKKFYEEVTCLHCKQQSLTGTHSTVIVWPFAVPRPKPLSTVVHKVDKGNPISRAVILSSAMNKLQELR